jgi:hypothetical protein
MNKLLQHTLMAYRPLYLNGLLLDGRYRLPSSAEAAPSPSPSSSSRRSGIRALLVALGGLGAHFLSNRNTPC